MNSDQLKEWAELTRLKSHGKIDGDYWIRKWKNGPWNIPDPKDQLLVATIENAYQTARLNELLESKAVQVVISSPNDGRLFKEES